MSILTQKEREGLEDVFLSINKPQGIFDRIKSITKLWKQFYFRKKAQTPFQIAPTGNFRDKSSIFFEFFSKVKKFLSK